MSDEHTITDRQAVTLEAGTVSLRDLTCDDPALAEVLAAHRPDEWHALVERVLSVGARGLLTMGLGVSIAELDERLRATLADVMSRAEACAAEAVTSAEATFTDQLDPELRSSLIGRTIVQMGTARDQLLDRLNPDLAGSDTAKFISQLHELLGPAGELEARLRDALDPDADGSALSRLGARLDSQFRELRDLMAMERGKALEAERGTAKGATFEDSLESTLRDISAGLGGCVVERTGRVAGALGPDVMVGDFVVTVPGGKRVVVEAKNSARLDLGGNGGILAELDRAAENREAEFAICISLNDAFPREVGAFGIYGRRLLVVDDGDGVLTAVALRWAVAILSDSTGPERAIDTTFVLDRLDRVKAMAQRFSAAKRTLTDVRSSIEGVRDHLDGMRSDLLDLVKDVNRHVRRPQVDQAPAPLLKIYAADSTAGRPVMERRETTEEAAS